MSALDWCSVSLIIMAIMILTVLVVMCTCFCVLKRSFKNRNKQQQQHKQQKSKAGSTSNQGQQDSDSNQTLNANVSCNLVDRVVSTLADLLIESPASNPNTLLLTPDQRRRVYPLQNFPFPFQDHHGNLYPWPYLPLPVPDSHACQALRHWPDFRHHEREANAITGTSITRADFVGSNISREDIHKAHFLEMNITGAGSSEANSELYVLPRTDGFKADSQGKDKDRRSEPRVKRRATDITRNSDPGTDIPICSSCSRIYRTYCSGDKTPLCLNLRTNDPNHSSAGPECFRPYISRTDNARVFVQETDQMGHFYRKTIHSTSSQGAADTFNIFNRGTNVSVFDLQKTNVQKAKNEHGNPKALRPRTDMCRCSESKTFHSEGRSPGMDILKSSYDSDSLSNSSSETSITQCFISKTEVLGSSQKKESKHTVSYIEPVILDDSRTYVLNVANSETDFFTTSCGSEMLSPSSPTRDILRYSYSRADYSEGPRQGRDINRYPKSMVSISEGPSPGLDFLKSSYRSDSLSDSSSGTSITQCCVSKTDVLGYSDKEAGKSTVSYKESEILNDSRTCINTFASSEIDFLTTSNGTANLRSFNPTHDILRCSYSSTDFSEGPSKGNNINRYFKSMKFISEGLCSGNDIFESSYGNGNMRSSTPGTDNLRCSYSGTDFCDGLNQENDILKYSDGNDNFIASSPVTNIVRPSHGTDNPTSSNPGNDILICSYSRTDGSEDPCTGTEIPMSSYGKDNFVSEY